jgi:large subunit ribosomal protein L3
MPRVHKPRSGSLQYWPRKRARRIYTRIRRWAKRDKVKLLGFAGYKVGMLNVLAFDNNQNSPSKGQQISIPVTVIECPPLKPFSLRLYKKTPYGSFSCVDIFASSFDKELARKIRIPKKTKNNINSIKNFEDKISEYSDLSLIVYTQPKKTFKKKPEIFELKVSGKDIKEKFDYAKSLLDKEINLKDVFQEGCYVDARAVTKGKGFQGAVKRFGISLKSHKSEKKRRSVGNLGSFVPRKVDWRVPQPGQMGYHTRTEYTKLIVCVRNPEDVNPNGGFSRYGVVKNNCVLLKGSVPGAVKRLIRFSDAFRKDKIEVIDVKEIIK